MSDAKNSIFQNTDHFSNRHIGINQKDTEIMLRALGIKNQDDLISQTIPENIRTKKTFANLLDGANESEALKEITAIGKENQIWRSYIGLGYSNTFTPPVILRNIMENPGWYTQYTPYQAEISQGRLEALLNFQTMISDLTGLPVSNASLLDEATAVAEAMALSLHVSESGGKKFFVSKLCHPQSIDVVKTRAWPLGIEVVVGDHKTTNFDQSFFGAVLQYPGTDGSIEDYSEFSNKLHSQKITLTVAADLLSLTLLKPPGEWGADIAVGSTQRFGVPLGYGGPHAAFLSTKEDFKRLIPGRIVGLSKDNRGKPAIRLALQTREQHIRREKATSNICTAQVLLGIMAATYAVYHGPKGLKAIAERVAKMTAFLRAILKKEGVEILGSNSFDTLLVNPTNLDQVKERAFGQKINLGTAISNRLTVSLDETVCVQDIQDLIYVFTGNKINIVDLENQSKGTDVGFDSKYKRSSAFLTHPVFNSYHTETELLRYLNRLQARDLSLTTSMISLGSCTMKLNATAEMIPVTQPAFANIHPFAPLEQTRGYQKLFTQLEDYLKEITGFDGVSLQPNAGSQGEYSGLLTIKKFHQDHGGEKRDLCLIPKSAHGTNPATATMAGMRVLVVECDSLGNVDLTDLKKKADDNREMLAALMVTYPSTHGVFEEGIRKICEIVHNAGGQVYMDGANMNAQVGIIRPGEFGPDVCHLNLHKTFAIPHGGGGPGVGPICVKKHLIPYLPNHPIVKAFSEQTRSIGSVAAAPWGSAGILPISWMYIRMMGAEGLKRATEAAILNANYIANRLDAHYPVLYKGARGRVAHECIIDMRPIKAKCGIDVEDVAKRLMDYGYHAPTVSFPVASTMMIEPTESESLHEIDRFCDAMISIRKEIKEIEDGKRDPKNNLLKNAPHTSETISATEWMMPYTREEAAFPVSYLREHKYWPPVGRIDNVFGDRNLVCACPPIESYSKN